LTRPATTATRTTDGWIVSGRKAFSTMSAAADVLYTSVTFAGDDGSERYGYAMVPRETPGVVVHDATGTRSVCVLRAVNGGERDRVVGLPCRLLACRLADRRPLCRAA